MSNHGKEFKDLADKYDTHIHCSKFTDYKYELFCKECGDFVAGKYKKCKTVKKSELYESSCCNAGLEVVNNDNKENNHNKCNHNEDNNSNESKDNSNIIIFEKVVNDYRFGKKIQLDTEYEQKEDIKELDWESTHRSWEHWANDGDGAWLIDYESKDKAKQKLENMNYDVKVTIDE